MKATPIEWDPKPHEREWYGHKRTGDRGWKVVRKGKFFIHMDRPQQVIERPFQEAEWVRELQRRPLTSYHLTQICFEADRALCRAIGMHDKASKTWLSLTDDQRARWMSSGPTEPTERAGLYKAIKKQLGPLAK